MPSTVITVKQEFLNNGPKLFGKDAAVAQYEKRISELERLLGRKENASTDETVRIVLEFQSKHPVIGYFRNDGKPGFDRNVDGGQVT